MSNEKELEKLRSEHILLCKEVDRLFEVYDMLEKDKIKTEKRCFDYIRMQTVRWRKLDEKINEKMHSHSNEGHEGQKCLWNNALREVKKEMKELEQLKVEK